MICTSITNRSCKIFPVRKVRDENTKVISEMKLLTSNSKTVPLNEVDALNDSEHLHSFFINTEKFGDKVDHFAQITAKQINVYNKKMKLRVTHQGLNVRGCVHIHDSYLYTVSDAIVKPPSVVNYKAEELQDGNE